MDLFTPEPSYAPSRALPLDEPDREELLELRTLTGVERQDLENDCSYQRLAQIKQNHIGEMK